MKKLNKKRMIELDIQSHCDDGYPDNRASCPGNCNDCLEKYFDWHEKQIKDCYDLDFSCEEIIKQLPHLRKYCDAGDKNNMCDDCKEMLWKYVTESPLRDIIKEVKDVRLEKTRKDRR